jgi:hypothetical protein
VSQNEGKLAKNDEENVQSYGAEYTYTSLEKYSNIMSLAVVRSCVDVYESTRAIFGTGKAFQGKVIEKTTSGKVAVDFILCKKNDQQFVSLVPGTVVKIIKCIPGTTVSFATRHSDNLSFDGILTPIGDSNQGFRVTFSAASHLQKCIEVGEAYKFQFSLKHNPTVAMRRLHTIQDFCKYATPGSARANLQNLVLQNNLLCSHSIPLFEQCHDVQKRKAAMSWISSKVPDPVQLKFIVESLYSPRAMFLFQGLSGTGKTRVNEMTAVALAVMGFSVAVCTPLVDAVQYLTTRIAAAKQRADILLGQTGLYEVLQHPLGDEQNIASPLPSQRATIVVSSCNDAFTLKGVFEPRVLIIDDASRGTEPDTLIPFSLEPVTIIMCAGPDQLPFVTSKRRSEVQNTPISRCSLDCLVYHHNPGPIPIMSHPSLAERSMF